MHWVHFLSHSFATRKHRFLRSALRIFLCLTGLVFQASGQLSTATITGTVTDSSGASVAGVKILVTETSTNFQSPSQTNAD
ncbi:MAG: hypothetical protein JWP08_1632, partial [Bryobacterales bacterium]|nr:hypothetical protein [Bryobacterales bacterium]